MTINTNLVCELQNAVKVQYLDGNLFSQDVQGNVINVTVLDGGEQATLAGSVSANIIRADGGTVAATGGSFSGNVASITLPAAAYAIPGVVSIVVKITDSGVTTTIAAVVANIYQSSTDTVVDPGTIIPSIQTLIAQIDAAVASIPADYSSLWSSLAPNYSIIGFPVYTGYLCTYDGVLYRAKCDIPSSETWNSSHWAQTNLGDYLHETKSAFNHSLSIAGENLLSISDFDTPTDANVTYSVSGGKITITNGSSANYAGLLTSSAFLAKLSVGRMYRFHARCSIDSGNGTPIIAAKAGNNYVNAIYIGVSASTVVDFVVASNTSGIALMVAFGSSTSGSVVSFDELWVKEMGQDAVARADISDVKSAIGDVDTRTNQILSYVNYGYDTPINYPIGDSSTWAKAIGVFRNGTTVVLNKTAPTTAAIRAKLTGEFSLAGTNSSVDAWETGISLKTGHQYKITSRLLSGSGVSGSDTHYAGEVGVYPTGTHESAGTSQSESGIMTRIFTAVENTSYNIAFYAGKSVTFTNAKLLITMEDITESEFVNLQTQIDEIKTTTEYIEYKLKSGNITSSGAAGDNNQYIRTYKGNMPKIESGDVLVADGGFAIDNAHIFKANNILKKHHVASLTITDANRLEVPDEYVGMYLGYTVYEPNKSGTDISGDVSDAEKNVKIAKETPLFETIGDLSSRVSALENEESDSGIPEYYFVDDYLEEKANDINTIGTGIGRNSVRTFFITDYHLEDNARNSPALIEYLINKTGIRNVIFGGDSMNHDYTSKEGGLALICEFLEDFRKVREAGNMFIITGNHEMNNADGGHDSVEFSKAVPYNLFNEPNYYKITSLWESTGKNTNSFYIDDTAAKIRTYCIDCNNSGVILKPILDAVIPSFKTVPEGFAVLITSHAGIGSATADESTTPPTYTVTSLAAAFEAIMETAAAMDSGISKTVEYVSGGTTYQYPVDFTDKQRTFIGAMVGHTHIDAYYIYDSKFPVVFTTCDTGAYRDTHPWREAGKTSEQAFDVVQIDVATKHIYCTRIGFGADREFTFGEGAGPVAES